MTAAVASSGDKRGDLLVQYGLGALLICAAAGGFLFGAIQMGTNGRVVFGAAARASKDAEGAEASAFVATEAAAKATEAVSIVTATATPHGTKSTTG